jgi:hypothetical protein
MFSLGIFSTDLGLNLLEVSVAVVLTLANIDHRAKSF